MTPQRWQEITAIFHDALERDVAERDAFLEAACRHDPSLRSDVDSMLAAHRDAGSFGDQPLTIAGARIQAAPAGHIDQLVSH